ncbi:hypothetical protein LA76x_5106 [Lysobacter antibioticus]|uniref:Uncharacterized protein n=1 Tax=Lysobacter antibioticus TaxID=84531 RepID=A0A0S2FI83_LYSAN|nr:hypothetical protein LA76x_5106 [Lysobacter antibioticus]
MPRSSPVNLPRFQRHYVAIARCGRSPAAFCDWRLRCVLAPVAP